MRVLILGTTGMLGHKLWQQYRNRFDVWATTRGEYRRIADFGIFDPERTLTGVDAINLDSVMQAVADVHPDIVINCIGIIKQLPSAKDPVVSLTVNSLFPHRLAAICQVAGVRLIHVSTDCVFAGTRGMYTEEDESDATDLYGRTKFLGELHEDNTLTLRTSIIGRELSSAHGLVDWFLSNRGGQVRGYTNAVYSGFTTLALAEIIAQVIETRPTLSGLYHVSSHPISKYNLLHLIKEKFGADVEIEPYADFRIDRSLDSMRFRTATAWTPPTWEAMIEAMAMDPTPYYQWRGSIEF